jgi:hypothetical protein
MFGEEWTALDVTQGSSPLHDCDWPSPLTSLPPSLADVLRAQREHTADILHAQRQQAVELAALRATCELMTQHVIVLSQSLLTYTAAIGLSPPPPLLAQSPAEQEEADDLPDESPPAFPPPPFVAQVLARSLAAQEEADELPDEAPPSSLVIRRPRIQVRHVPKGLIRERLCAAGAMAYSVIM